MVDASILMICALVHGLGTSYKIWALYDGYKILGEVEDSFLLVEYGGQSLEARSWIDWFPF